MRVGVRLVAPAAAVLSLAVGASAANAANGYQLKVSPKSVKQGGKVTIETTPRRSCELQVTIAGKRFTHSMKYGVVFMHLPGNEVVGRAKVKTICSGAVGNGSFTIVKK
jgi:hypothetical protein